MTPGAINSDGAFFPEVGEASDYHLDEAVISLELEGNVCPPYVHTQPEDQI